MTGPVEPPPASDPPPRDLTKMSGADLEQLRDDALYRVDWLNDQRETFGKGPIQEVGSFVASDPAAQDELDRQNRLLDDIRAEFQRRRALAPDAAGGSANPPIEFAPSEPDPAGPGSAPPALPEGVVWDPLTPGTSSPIDTVPADAGSYDDGHRFGWKKLVLAGLVAGIVAAFGLTLLLSGSSESSTTAAPSSVPASNHATSSPRTASSPTAAAATVTITDNEDKFIGGDVCNGGILHLEWDISGGRSGEVVVVKESGPRLPAKRTFMLDSDGHFEVDVHTGGNGEYTTKIVSIGGQPPPDANSTNSASVTGCT